MDQYRKRAKDGWCCGKKYKRDSNKQERNFAKNEIHEALEEHDQGEDFRYKYSRRKPRNEIASLKARLDRDQRQLQYYVNRGDRYCWFTDHLRGWIERTKKELEKLGVEID